VIVVADTHSLVRALTLPRSLGRHAARVFRRAERGLDEVRVPSIVLFELALLLERGRLRSALSWDEWLSVLAASPGLEVEPLGAEDVSYSRDLPMLVDPFDRLIVATALRLGTPLVTADERIARSRVVPVLW
jgi:PIN domain nuclease of toxin-antitoxin system